MMNNELLKAALKRVQRTAIEYAIATIPSGIVITPAMLKDFDAKQAAYIVGAWLATGLATCIVAFLWAIKDGLPEVEVPDEVRSADVIKEPTQHYIDEDAEYDYLRIDENVDEGEEDEVESED